MFGKTRSSIVFQNNEWHFKAGRRSVYTTSGKMIPLGIHEWNGTEGTFKMILHKKVEQPGHFCCDDGVCIPSKFVCDTVQNCEDNSDERNCQKVIFDKNYNKDIPSRPNDLTQDHDPLHYLKIDTRVKIIDFISVSQNTGEMSLFIRLTFYWYDSKLKYLYLDDHLRHNDLNETLGKKIWTPIIDYMYLKNRREVFRKLSITKIKDPKISEKINILQPLEIYEGSENSIRFEIYERVDLVCSFDQIKKYPFGDDFCDFDIYLDGKDNSFATFYPVTLSK